ncbi:MAG: SUMF1/EgtB/PvdO family nonheme iron enzyme [Bacteroidaceae bacterium]
MKQILSFLLLWAAFGLGALAQNISVTSFRFDEYDLTANLAGTSVEDQNGNKCALIRIQTTEKGFSFDVGVLGVQKVDDNKVGEVWVYVPAGVRKMTIRHQQLGTLSEYVFPVNIVGSKTYVMELTTAQVQTIVKKAVTQQYVSFSVTPADAIVEFDGDILEVVDGTASRRKAFGTYTYTVRSRLYHPQTGQVTVNDPKNRHEVRVELRPAYGYLEVPGEGALQGARVFVDDEYAGTAPYRSDRLASGEHQVRIVQNLYGPVSERVVIADGQTLRFAPTLRADFARLTLAVDGGADIWVNDQRKGSGSWTDILASGDYRVECRLPSHRSTVRELTVDPTMDGRTIRLDTPTPIYGSLDISSTPAGADIWIDGTKVGTTPMLLPECLVGDHTVRISKAGYGDYTRAVALAEDATEEISCRLEDGRPVVISAPAGADIYVDGRRVATGRFEGSLSYGSHTAYAARDGKQTAAQTIDVPMGSGALPSVTLAFFGPQTFRVNGVSFVMMPVEAGTFTMGATSEMKDPYSDEKPTHRVTLTRNYYLGRTEVTQALWQAVMGKNPSQFKGDERPVENVSWEDCQQFLQKLNKLTGRTFRLPTEAEWEYAARGGRKGQGCPYSGSRTLDDVAWYDGNSNGQTHDVGTKQPNELGLYDMTGNVWEWCSDWYGSYSSAAQTDPAGPSSGSYRVYRGGSWYDGARFCRSSIRVNYAPGGRHSDLGLRLCLSE